MKWILMILLVLSFSVHAKKEEKGKNFEERKAKAIEMVGKKIDALTKLKSCMSSASDRKALKECRKSHKDSAKDWRKAKKRRKGKRGERGKRKGQEEDSE